MKATVGTGSRAFVMAGSPSSASDTIDTMVTPMPADFMPTLTEEGHTSSSWAVVIAATARRSGLPLAFMPGSVRMTTTQRKAVSLADAELGEDAVEQIGGGCLTGDLAERFERGAQVNRDEIERRLGGERLGRGA